MVNAVFYFPNFGLPFLRLPGETSLPLVYNEFFLGIYIFFGIKYEIVVKFIFLGSQKWKNMTLN